MFLDMYEQLLAKLVGGVMATGPHSQPDAKVEPKVSDGIVHCNGQHEDTAPKAPTCITTHSPLRGCIQHPFFNSVTPIEREMHRGQKVSCQYRCERAQSFCGTPHTTSPQIGLPSSSMLP